MSGIRKSNSELGKSISKYDGLLDLPHFHAEGRPYMSRKDRAAQFMPFKALEGFEEEIGEEAGVLSEG